MKKYLGILLSMLILGLAACSDGAAASSIPAQHWKEWDVSIQTHPSPPLAGMCEIVVIITGPHGKPGGHMIVSLRGMDSEPWMQAIEDGYIGVYRRAVDVGENKTGVVQVRIQQGSEQKTLLFPVTLALN